MGGQLVQDTFAANGYRIEVNKAQSVEARRFSVAHEMGHFYRHTDHSDPLADPMYFDLSASAFYVETEKEREANEFAEALLFGDGQLAAAYGLLGGDMQKIARYFGVTAAVLRIAVEKLRG
jgi:Zn-dependent peptidase ImmA (M78 family)